VVSANPARNAANGNLVRAATANREVMIVLLETKVATVNRAPTEVSARLVKAVNGNPAKNEVNGLRAAKAMNASPERKRGTTPVGRSAANVLPGRNQVSARLVKVNGNLVKAITNLEPRVESVPPEVNAANVSQDPRTVNARHRRSVRRAPPQTKAASANNVAAGAVKLLASFHSKG
jgi:hypothetical protein